MWLDWEAGGRGCFLAFQRCFKENPLSVLFSLLRVYLVPSLIIIIFILEPPQIKSGRLAWVNGFLGKEGRKFIFWFLSCILIVVRGKNSLLLVVSWYGNAEWWCRLRSWIGFGEKGKFSLVTDPYDSISSKLIPGLCLNSLHERCAVVFIWYRWFAGPNFSEGVRLMLWKLGEGGNSEGKNL